VLIHAFCGCETGHVLDAIGLTLSDLFDQPLTNHIAPSPSRIPARDLLAVISEEVSVVAIIVSDFLAQRCLAENEWLRLAQAAARIGAARDHAR
jgi:hypothetical protein